LNFSVASFASAPNLLQHALHKLLCMFQNRSVSCCFWDFIAGEILLLSCTQQTYFLPICVGILCLHLCSYLNLRLLLGEWLSNLTKKLTQWAYSPLLLVNTVKQLIAIGKAHNSIAPELITTQRFRDTCYLFTNTITLTWLFCTPFTAPTT
jgi:hypothetical protein